MTARNHLASLAGNPDYSAHDRATWQSALVLGLAALAIRLVFFNGPFGSDDTVYLTRAMEIARGDWSSSSYNGALRYAFNLPAGALVYLLGPSTAAANVWPLACSLVEVVLVYLIATDIWGRRAGLIAGAVLATIPLHVAVASRIHADPVVSMFLSLGFAFLYFGSTRARSSLLFASGLALGGVFWAKELAAVTLFAFLAFPLVWRRAPPGWPYVVAGGAAALLAHLALMVVIAGDPFHVFKVALGHSFIREGVGDGSAWYYFRYLLVDLRHTWLASLLAFAACVLIIRERDVSWSRMDGRSFAVIWFVSVLAVLSFFPISLSPLRFAMKQSNYLTLFLAPIAVLAGYALSRLSGWLATGATATTLLGGCVLAAFQQADYRVFVSNSKAAHSFAQTHPGHAVVGSRNNSSLSLYYATLNRDSVRTPPILTFSEAAEPPAAARMQETSDPAYVVWDLQTLAWMSGKVAPQAPLPCWLRVAALAPEALAPANHALAKVATYAPDRIASALNRIAWPAPATVYAVQPNNLWCGQAPPGSVNR